MIVSEEVRLTSMISALTGTIVPALGDNSFAAEQAALVVGHLQVLRAHLDYSDEYEALEYAQALQLGHALVALSEGGAKTVGAAARLQSELDTPVPSNIREIREADRRVSTAVADLIEAQGQDGSSACIQQSTRTVLRHEHTQSIRDRSYFAPFGYEDGARPIPSMDAMMDDFRSHYTEQESSTPS